MKKNHKISNLNLILKNKKYLVQLYPKTFDSEILATVTDVIRTSDVV